MCDVWSLLLLETENKLILVSTYQIVQLFEDGFNYIISQNKQEMPPSMPKIKALESNC